MNRKHTICYTLATFCACQRHQNIDIWVSKINTFEIPPNLAPSCRTQTPGILTHAAKKSRFLRARGHFHPTQPSVMLPEAPKIMDLTTHTTTCCNEQKTYYLLYFTYILGMPETPKYRHLGIYPKSTLTAHSTQHTAHKKQHSTQHTAHSTQHTAGW